MSNVKEVASTINCKNGSVRSLALNTKSVLEANGLGGDDPSKAAWDFAKEVKKEHGDDFTKENAQKHFTATFSSNGNGADLTHKSKTEAKPSNKTGNTSSKKGIPEFGRKSNSILNSDDSINEKIRQLLTLGHGISQIAKNVVGQEGKPLSYQRVKNVKKAMEKKSDA